MCLIAASSICNFDSGETAWSENILSMRSTRSHACILIFSYEGPADIPYLYALENITDNEQICAELIAKSNDLIEFARSDKCPIIRRLFFLDFFKNRHSSIGRHERFKLCHTMYELLLRNSRRCHIENNGFSFVAYFFEKIIKILGRKYLRGNENVSEILEAIKAQCSWFWQIRIMYLWYRTIEKNQMFFKTWLYNRNSIILFLRQKSTSWKPQHQKKNHPLSETGKPREICIEKIIEIHDREGDAYQNWTYESRFFRRKVMLQSVETIEELANMLIIEQTHEKQRNPHGKNNFETSILPMTVIVHVMHQSNYDPWVRWMQGIKTWSFPERGNFKMSGIPREKMKKHSKTQKFRYWPHTHLYRCGKIHRKPVVLL